MEKSGLILISLIILVIFLAFLSQIFFPKQGYFSELYFENSSKISLLESMSLNNDYSFSFVIESHERALKSYDYFIESEIKEQEGKITLNPGDSKIIEISLKPDKLVENDKLTINLGNLSIYFYYSVKK